MKVGEKEYRSIWQNEEDRRSVCVIDQRKLPFSFEVITLRSVGEVCEAISGMVVRGAPLIGATAAWGIFLSFVEHCNSSDVLSLVAADAQRLKATRPTAVNLAWAVDEMTDVLKDNQDEEAMREAAASLCDLEAERSRSIGLHGLPLIEDISRQKGGGAVDILTHCNAGWLACVDYGTALAPVYLAHDKGIRVHVWVSETRPRNQGARLTAWELSNHGIPCTLVTDSSAGHLMQNGMVDMVIVGCDRATANGDVANKTGTYMKALVARDNGIPFYSAFPVSTFDLSIHRPEQISIEERDGDEVRKIEGLADIDIADPAETLPATSPQSYQPESVYICQPDIPVTNYGFDVTPARLITGIITDRGVCHANRDAIKKILS
jgi:methylthioribose-1-phosphate isomerase